MLGVISNVKNLYLVCLIGAYLELGEMSHWLS